MTLGLLTKARAMPTLLLAAAHLSGQVVGAAKQAHAFQFLAGQL